MLSNDILEQMTVTEIWRHMDLMSNLHRGFCRIHAENMKDFEKEMTFKYKPHWVRQEIAIDPETNYFKLKHINEMENVNINIPEGYEVDWAKSAALQEVVLKKKGVAYKDVAEKLFNEKEYYFTNQEGIINRGRGNSINSPIRRIYDPNNAPTSEQLEAILALNQLCNVAKYLNDGWLPDWKRKYYYYIENNPTPLIVIDYGYKLQRGQVFFKTKELAKQAIEILGEDTIRKALTLNH